SSSPVPSSSPSASPSSSSPSSSTSLSLPTSLVAPGSTTLAPLPTNPQSSRTSSLFISLNPRVLTTSPQFSKQTFPARRSRPRSSASRAAAQTIVAYSTDKSRKSLPRHKVRRRLTL